jgi:DNA-binding beta-propeller fold protein YncE
MMRQSLKSIGRKDIFSVRLTGIILSIILSFILLFVHTASSQQLGYIITYDGSITADEDEKSLQYPSVLHIDRTTGDVYVVDGRSRILIYTSDLFPLYTINSKNGIYTPHGLTVDEEGNLYVAQAPSEMDPRYRISVLNACMKWERDIYMEGFEGAETFVPFHLEIDRQGILYVAGRFTPRVLVMNNRGRLMGILSPEEDGEKVKLNNVSIDEEGNIYLLSEDKGRVYVYDKNRKFLFKFGEKGGSTGELSRPRGVGVDDRNGWLYIVDYMRHTTSVYDTKGNFMFEFGGLGWGEGWFQHPVDIEIDRNGRIFVADRFNQRVQIFKSWERTGKDSIPGKKILVTETVIKKK